MRRIRARRHAHPDDHIDVAESRAVRNHASRGADLRAGQRVGVKQVGEHIWLVTFMHYRSRYFDDQTCRLEQMPGPYAILRPATRLSTQDIETICSAARQADASAADRR
jgi:hypothetical protein